MSEVGPNGSVTGVDLAADMIEVAESVPHTGAPIDWRVGDATALQFPDEAYDVVLCQMGLMFMDDRAAAIAEMRRVPARGGRMVINTPGAIQRPFEPMEKAIVEHISPELGGFVRAHQPNADGAHRGPSPSCRQDGYAVRRGRDVVALRGRRCHPSRSTHDCDFGS